MPVVLAGARMVPAPLQRCAAQPYSWPEAARPGCQRFGGWRDGFRHRSARAPAVEAGGGRRSSVGCRDSSTGKVGADDPAACMASSASCVWLTPTCGRGWTFWRCSSRRSCTRTRHRAPLRVPGSQGQSHQESCSGTAPVCVCSRKRLEYGVFVWPAMSSWDGRFLLTRSSSRIFWKGSTGARRNNAGGRLPLAEDLRRIDSGLCLQGGNRPEAWYNRPCPSTLPACRKT